jgi:hypothetical protein
VLADDPLFGRFCFGGDWKSQGSSLEVIPKDGVRRRFHALIGGRKLHVTLHSDRFARGKPIVLDESLSTVRFELESGDSAAHVTRLSLRASSGSGYRVQVGDKILTAGAKPDEEISVDLPVEGAASTVRIELQ